MKKDVDVDLLSRILKKYESEPKVTFDELELDEGQKSYVTGYLACMEERDDTGSLEETVREQINQVRSKYCEPILDILETEGDLYHGDLADKLELSPSGLNAIIKKMQEAELPLIQTSQIGKYKIYSLSEETKEYLRQKRMKGDQRLDRKSLNEEKRTSLFLPLQRFVESAGTGWKDMLGELLQGDHAECTEQTLNHFYEFTGQMAELSRHKSMDVERIQKFLGNDVLNYLLEDFLKEEIQCQDYLTAMEESENGRRNRELLKYLVLKEEEK